MTERKGELAPIDFMQFMTADVVAENERRARELHGPRKTAQEQQAEAEARYAADVLRIKAKRFEALGVNITPADRDALYAGTLSPDRPASARADRYHVEGAPGSLLALLGGTGCGKTVAAARLLWAHGGDYIRSDTLARLACSKYGPDADALDERLRTDGLFVVDDVGTEDDAGAAKHALFKLVDMRQASRGLTVLTGNRTVAQLRERMCERTLSRLRGSGVIYECPGADLRGQP